MKSGHIVYLAQGRNEGGKGRTLHRAPNHHGAPNHCEGR